MPGNPASGPPEGHQELHQRLASLLGVDPAKRLDRFAANVLVRVAKRFHEGGDGLLRLRSRVSPVARHSLIPPFQPGASALQL